MYPTQKEYQRLRHRERTIRDIKIIVFALIIGVLLGLLI